MRNNSNLGKEVKVLAQHIGLSVSKKTTAHKWILALMVGFFLLTGLKVFEDGLKELMGGGVSFKFQWYQRFLTIPLYLILLAFVFYPKATVKFVIEILSKLIID